MSKERDLVVDLGRNNWLDSAAGEALLLGSLMGEPELVMRGTELARLIGEIDYDDDNFSKVIAAGIDLRKRIDKAKEFQKTITFIDEIVVRERGVRSSIDWEYNLVLADGRYQINMTMPEYYGSEPEDKQAERVSEVISVILLRGVSDTQRVESSKMMGCQQMDSVELGSGGKLLFKQVDFNHECLYKRGQLRNYYFDDFDLAMEAWRQVKAILDQKTSG